MLKHKKMNNGYIMIEVLVAVIVFSVSMIALLTLQTTALSSDQSAGYRTTAINYTYDLIDKMRANKTGVTAGSYLGSSGADNSCRALNFNTKHATVAACTGVQMAQDDLNEFFKEVATLPHGTAVVCLDSKRSSGTPAAPNCDNSGTDYVIKVFWSDSRSQNMGGYSQVIIGTQL